MGIFATSRDRQLRYWSSADGAHYLWQTGPGYFAETERALLEMAALPGDGRLLEIGCGEGANLHHLGARPGWVGLDFAQEKLRWAAGALPGVRFTRGDAAALPFADGAFDAVLIRDVLHHVPDRAAVVAEAARVLERGGVLAAIEPNRSSPLIVAQALLVKEERAVLMSHAARLAAELRDAGLRDVSVRGAQPFPFARLLTHPGLGLDGLGRRPAVAAALRALDAAAERLVPSRAWMYLVARGRKG